MVERLIFKVITFVKCFKGIVKRIKAEIDKKAKLAQS